VGEGLALFVPVTVVLDDVTDQDVGVECRHAAFR
jgi:hypothetical protein